MKRLLVVVLFLVPCLLVAQNRPVARGYTKVGSATTAWAAVFIGQAEKDLAIYNRDTGSDTLKVAFQKMDTTFSERTVSTPVLQVLAGEIHNVSRIPQDTLWIKASGTTPYTITGVIR